MRILAFHCLSLKILTDVGSWASAILGFWKERQVSPASFKKNLRFIMTRESLVNFVEHMKRAMYRRVQHPLRDTSRIFPKVQLGLILRIFGLREPCSRFRRAKPCFVRSGPEAWLPILKAPAWLAHSKRELPKLHYIWAAIRQNYPDHYHAL